MKFLDDSASFLQEKLKNHVILTKNLNILAKIQKIPKKIRKIPKFLGFLGTPVETPVETPVSSIQDTWGHLAQTPAAYGRFDS